MFLFGFWLRNGPSIKEELEDATGGMEGKGRRGRGHPKCVEVRTGGGG